MDIAIKHSSGEYLGLFAWEPSLYVKVKGSQENSLDFIGRLGMVVDPIIDKPSNNERFYIIQNNLAITGQICFPTKYENLAILFGIGIEYGIRPTIGYGSWNKASGFSINEDSTANNVQANRRRVLPSVSGGITYTPFIDKKISLHFIIKQNLLKLFSEDIDVTYRNGSFSNTTPLNYKPTYFKVGISYEFL